MALARREKYRKLRKIQASTQQPQPHTHVASPSMQPAAGDDPLTPSKVRTAGANVPPSQLLRTSSAASTGAVGPSAASADMLAAVMAGMQQQAEQHSRAAQQQAAQQAELVRAMQQQAEHHAAALQQQAEAHTKAIERAMDKQAEAHARSMEQLAEANARAMEQQAATMNALMESHSAQLQISAQLQMLLEREAFAAAASRQLDQLPPAASQASDRDLFEKTGESSPGVASYRQPRETHQGRHAEVAPQAGSPQISSLPVSVAARPPVNSLLPAIRRDGRGQGGSSSSQGRPKPMDTRYY